MDSRFRRNDGEGVRGARTRPMKRIALLSAATLAIAALAIRAGAAAETATPADSYFQAEIVPLLTANCAICHMTGEEAGNMSLVPDNAIASLVGVASAEAPTQTRVVPGDPDKSYLVMKLEGTHMAHGGAGARMPFGGAPLPAEEIGKVRKWIAEGARP
jgi:hypothetical protein